MTENAFGISKETETLLRRGNKTEKWHSCHNLPTWHHRQFFAVIVFVLSNLVTGPGFYVNITTGPGVMEIVVCSGLTRNQEFRNTPVDVLPNICRMGQISYTKFCTNVSNEKLVNLSKCQGYSYYCFWVILGKPTRGKVTPHLDSGASIMLILVKFPLITMIYFLIWCKKLHVSGGSFFHSNTK